MTMAWNGDGQLLARRPTPLGVVPTRVVQTVAAVTLVMTGLRINVSQGITVGTLLAVVLLPIWWNVLTRYRGARVLAVLLVLCLINGLWLTELSSSDHATSIAATVTGSATVFGLLVSMGVIVWAREHLTDAAVGLFFGLGILVGVVTNDRGELFSENPWKFGISTAVTIVVLAVAGRSGKRWLELVALVAILVTSALNDQRSAFAILILALILTAIQLRPDRHDRRASTIRLTVAIAGIAGIVFNVGQTLILDGYLGDAAQERTAAQINLSGSLILGGRPELAASFALFQSRPWGFGTGTLPSLSDITVAKTGMSNIGYQPNNGYVENYMFGRGYELHSLVGDLWISYGAAGLALAAVIVALGIRSLTVRLASNAASALVIYLVIQGFWNLLFSPIFGSTLPLILLLGLVLQRRDSPDGLHPRTGNRVTLSTVYFSPRSLLRRGRARTSRPTA